MSSQKRRKLIGEIKRKNKSLPHLYRFDWLAFVDVAFVDESVSTDELIAARLDFNAIEMRMFRMSWYTDEVVEMSILPNCSKISLSSVDGGEHSFW